ncbi:transposase [Deinococcus sp. SDU3-2]|uniref:Transposase n=1 Tax=Deinococcus terrestris TaxID=2651870 RepID=A0A7X1NYY8_9DEIO|nr:transposase [Deinococcus terrestris]
MVGRLRDLAEQRPRFGYRRLHILLGREGQAFNHKRVYRLYRAEGLAVGTAPEKPSSGIARLRRLQQLSPGAGVAQS